MAPGGLVCNSSVSWQNVGPLCAVPAAPSCDTACEVTRIHLQLYLEPQLCGALKYRGRSR